MRAETAANAQTGGAAVETAAGAAVPSSDPLTVFQKQVLKAFSPTGLPFTGLTLTGTIDRKAGSLAESGTVKLQSASDGSSLEQWNGAGEDRVIRHTAMSGERACTLTTKKAAAKDLEGVECERVLPWFAPWAAMPLLPSALAAATESTTEAGDTVLTFAPSYGSLSSFPVKAQKRLHQLTSDASIDVLYDTKTALPSGLHYKQPLSSEQTHAIDISVVYSDYHLDQGFMLPHRIQRYVQRTLESDIHITNVVLN